MSKVDIIDQRVNVCLVNSKKEGVPFDIDREFIKGLLETPVCSYCGDCIDNTNPKKKGCISRKQAKEGYIKSNLFIACFDCTRVKSITRSYDEMLAVTNLLKTLRSK